MSRCFTQYWFFTFFALSALMLLPSCGLFTPEAPPRPAKPKAAKPAKPAPGADTFIEHVALARLMLNAGEDVASNLSAIDDYSAQPPKTGNQTVIVIEYKAEGGKKAQEVIAPITLPSENNTFPALYRVITQLSKKPHALHELRLGTATVTLNAPLKLSKAHFEEIRPALEREHRRLLHNLQPLSPLADAEAQLHLARFFINHRFKEAAYLSADNVKQILAREAAADSHEETVKRLSQDLEDVEKLLHTTLPFTLSGS